eukprot:66729_1
MSTELKNRVVNINAKFNLFSEHWTPQIIGDLNENHIKIAKIKGEFVWHHHDVDEMFLIIKGNVIIKLRDRDVNLTEGEMFIVPKYIEHKPIVPNDQEAYIMLVEPKEVVNTGNVVSDLTKKKLSKL